MKLQKHECMTKNDFLICVCIKGKYTNKYYINKLYIFNIYKIHNYQYFNLTIIKL